jgi:hypothetical protein
MIASRHMTSAILSRIYGYLMPLRKVQTGAKSPQMVFGLDAAAEPERARRSMTAILARARWMTEHGYKHLLDKSREG